MGVTRRILLIACAALPLCASAQEPPYPQRGNVEITVLFPAGTSADVTARLLAEGMSKQLGQTVLVVNRPGAGGAIGYKYVASQKPDGYSLVWNSNSISTTYHSGQLAFDYKAFDPVARVLVESPVVAVRADARWKTLGDLMADAKARPGIITVGNSGIGSHTHISSVALFHAAGVKIVDVPYAAAQVVPNLLGGHVDVLVQLPGALAAQVKSGNVRLLATMIPARDPALPDVPTAKEQGVDVSLEAWRGIAVPRGTPGPTIVALERAIRQTAESPEFARSAEKLGVRPAYMPAGEFGELIAKEDAQLAQLMSLIGLKKQ
jgi:tripartite-type tricarboxylate transporter receptor subunit TctC